MDPLRNLAADSPGRRILAAAVQRTDISFEPHPAANPESRRQQLKRFQLNPEPNWGPKMRAKTSTLAGGERNNKQQRNQDRKQRKTPPSPANGEEEESAKKQRCDSTSEPPPPS